MIDPLNPAPWFGPRGVGGMPVGAVVAFAGQVGTPIPNTASPVDVVPAATGSPPAATAQIEAWGWMACDGRTLAVSLYPELFAALGYLYGGGADSFNLPDYRGYFLRGCDWGAGNDPDAAARIPASGGTAADVGSTQASAMLSHKHDYSQSATPVTVQAGSAVEVPSTASQLTSVPVADDGSALTGQLSQKESRPINIYVTYIIKFTTVLHFAAPYRPNAGD